MATTIVLTASNTFDISLDTTHYANTLGDYKNHLIPRSSIRIAQKSNSEVDIYWTGDVDFEIEIDVDPGVHDVSVSGVNATDNDDLFAKLKALM